MNVSPKDIGINEYTFSKSRDELFEVEPDKTLCCHFIINSEKEILENQKDATAYRLRLHRIVTLEKENKLFKEKIGVLLAESHIANEQITNMSFELEELRAQIAKVGGRTTKEGD